MRIEYQMATQRVLYQNVLEIYTGEGLQVSKNRDLMLHNQTVHCKLFSRKTFCGG